MNAAAIELKIELLRRGIACNEIADRLGISPQYLCDVMKGRTSAPHIRKRLVEEIGLPAHLVAHKPNHEPLSRAAA